MRVYHGTSSIVDLKIFSGNPVDVERVFRDSNASLGGTYVTKDRALAEIYADHTTRALGGHPVVYELEVSSSDLFPDEDWVVEGARAPRLGSRLQKFMDDLFIGYPGEGFSLSDHYKERYEELNRRHGITWKDSWKWSGTARLEKVIRPEMVVEVKTRNN